MIRAWSRCPSPRWRPRPTARFTLPRPLTGQVMAIRDSDGDTLPDDMDVFAAGLTLPNGLAFHDGDLYVAGGSHIYRISPDGEVTTLVDDLPAGVGFPTAGLAIGADERLYVAIGAPCSNCDFAAAERGAILSMNLDGGDRRVFASGFRNPADVAWYRGRLWTLDSAPPQAERNALDELNRLEAGGWYGFPYCLGAGTANLIGDRGCRESIAPAMRFGTGAVPIGSGRLSARSAARNGRHLDRRAQRRAKPGRFRRLQSHHDQF